MADFAGFSNTTARSTSLGETRRGNSWLLFQEKLNPFIGKPIWKIDLDELKNIIQSEPYIGAVKILRLLPDRFLVQLSARQPILVLLDSKGKMHPLSVDGKLLPPLSSQAGS